MKFVQVMLDIKKHMEKEAVEDIVNVFPTGTVYAIEERVGVSDDNQGKETIQLGQSNLAAY